eukprot:CAMPEP_0176486492 /NCGR_PEP_ID=MMETSP0200_2-20121128/5595_1 /TAXON_ID=947934 /ORGANISM="Chaetoceros sp., Strain GSL56" /LENGTH=153 /DNA_ID=CAMNT_0017883193 /DNA_START=217 /DNA_END=678 /DNA_ORIENTATION=-
MNHIRNLARTQPFQKARILQQRRPFGAASSSSQPQSQSQQARLWEGHNTEPEGWETTVYATYLASTVLITLALGFAPDTSINTWAGNEARVRMEMKAAGGMEQEEFGVHYNVPEKVYDFDMKSVDNPFNEEDDDEDEEDEDEEEDEVEDDDDE